MAAQPHLTADEQLFILGQFMEATAQLVQGDVQRPRDAPQLVELGGVAHIHHLLMGVASLHLGCVAEQGVPLQMVARHEPGHVDHVLGRAKGRRIGELQILQIEHGEPGTLGHRQHVDALVDAILADGLGAVDLAIGGKQQLEADRVGTGVVAGVAARVDIDLLERQPQLHQPLLVQPRARHRQIEQLADGGPLRLLVGLASPQHVVGGDAPLAVGGARQRDQHGLAGDKIGLLHRIPHRVDEGIRGTHPGIHFDAAPRSQHQPRLGGEQSLGLDADGEDQQAGVEMRAVIEGQAQSTLLGGRHGGSLLGRHLQALDGSEAGAQAKIDPLLPDAGVEQVGHLLVHRRHHLIGELQQGDIQLALVQRLHHLQPDETAPHHGDVAGLVVRQRRQDAIHVGNAPQGVYPRAVDAGEGRPDGRRPRAQQQHVVGFAPLFAGQQVAHQQALAGPVYLDDVVKHPHIHVEAALEALRCLQQQGIPIRDIPPDVIRQTAVGEAHELAPLEHHDLRLFAQTAGTGGGGRPPGHTTHNQDPFHLQDSTQQEMTNKLDLSNLEFNEILFATDLQYSCPPTIAQQDSVSSCRLPRSAIFRPPARRPCFSAWIPVVNGWSP